MFEGFQQQLQQSHFTPVEIDQLIQAAKFIEFPQGHILLRHGDTPKEIYFLVDGICHASYLTNKGKAFCKQFYWENDWIVGFESLLNQRPSPYQLESLSQCSLLSLPIETLQTWRQQKHCLYLKLLETQLLYKENKERFMLLYTPEERYQQFCQHYPELLERLCDYQIAAYLGITSISLSRIKKRPQN